MNLKMIVMDIDGTLAQDDHIHISKRNIEALKKAKDAGYLLTIASGRTYASAQIILDQIPFVDYIITCNGTSAWYVPEVKELYHTGMKYETWCRVYDILMEYEILTEVYTGGTSYMEERFLDRYANAGWSPEMTERFKKMINTFPGDAKEALAGKLVDKLCCLADRPERDRAAYEKIMDLGTVVITSSLANNWEINEKGMHKGFGLQTLCDHIGMDPSRVCAFGDEGNDLEMLLLAGESYAMENGSEAVKAAAKHLAPSNMEDGVAQIIESLLL